jgi:hypothetical protein
MFKNIFKNRDVYEIRGKYCTAGEATRDNAAHASAC